MSALLKPIDNIVPFTLPKRKPKLIQKDAPPDLRKFCVIPLAAIQDKELTHSSIRVLGMLCAYCNRAGITWVGQRKLAADLNVSKQAVNRQILLLKERGHIEVMKKGFRGQRADTIRVVFDKTLSAEDAVSITSAIEDTRPPHMVRQEKKEMDEATRQQLNQQYKEAMKSMTRPDVMKIDTTPKETDTLAVKQTKDVIRAQQERVTRRKKAVDKSSKPVDNSVDNSNSTAHIVNTQVDSIVNIGVDRTQFLTNRLVTSKEVNKQLSNKLIKVYKELVWSTCKVERTMNEQDLKVMEELVDAGLTEQLWTDVVTDTVQTFANQRRDPPHRIGYFRDTLLKVLHTV